MHGGVYNILMYVAEISVLLSLKVPTQTHMSIEELGKQLWHAASDGDAEEIRNLMNRGAPFTADWVKIYISKLIKYLFIAFNSWEQVLYT